MKLNDEFQLVNIADEHMAVPVGNRTSTVQGIIVLNEETAFLLENMNKGKSLEIEDLVMLLTKEYNVDDETARNDIKKVIPRLFDLQLIVK